MKNKVSIVTLNYKREQNVWELCRRYSAMDIVKEIIVWSNAPGNFSSSDPKVWCVNSNRQAGLFPRYAMAALAASPCVMIVDDDLFVPVDTVEALYQNFLGAMNTAIHGLFGRRPTAQNTYAEFRDHDNADCEIVLGRCQMFSRKLAARFLSTLPDTYASTLVEMAHKYDLQLSQADDILFSYSVMATNGGFLNVVYNLPREELSAEHGLCEQTGHYVFRQAVMRWCQKFYRL